MKNTLKSLLILLFAAMAMPSLTLAQNPRDILKKAEDKFRGESSFIEMKMTIVRPKWTRDVEMKAWSMGQDYSLILVTAPDRDKGVVYLKRKNEIWNWIPSIERNVKMPPSMMTQSWMGSDFKNDDLVRESSTLDDFDHKLEGTETLEGRECYKISMTPKPDAQVLWGKIVTWISKGDYLQLKSEMYDEFDELVNTLTFHNIREMDGREVPTKMVMTPADNPGQQTVMEYKSLDYNIDLDESFFSLQNMKRIK